MSAGPHAAHRAPVEDVIAALLDLNSHDVPYEVSVERTAKGAVVTAAWKGSDVRWRSFLGGGTATKSFRLVVTLRAGRGTYRFTEIHGSSRKSLSVSPWGVHADARGNVFRGKTVGLRSTRLVVAPRVTASGERGYEVSNVAVMTFTPSTIKVPVFSILRSLGWRPRVDNRFVRRFED